VTAPGNALQVALAIDVPDREAELLRIVDELTAQGVAVAIVDKGVPEHAAASLALSPDLAASRMASRSAFSFSW